MLDFLVHNIIVDFFVSNGWLGFIGYMVLAYGGLFCLGIELKSRGVFENKIFRWVYEIAGGIVGAIVWAIVGGIVGAIVWVIVWAIVWAIVGGITGEIVLAIVLAIVGGITGEIVWAIAREIVGGITGEIGFAIVLAIVLAIVGGITGEIVLVIVLVIVLAIVLAIVGGITGEIVLAIAGAIAESKYNKALKYLKNVDICNCSKYLNKSLYLIKDYSYEENDKDSEPYFNMELANKIISLNNELEPIQKANNYYNSNNYIEAFKIYNNIISKNPDLKEIVEDKYEKIKIQIENQFSKEIQKPDNLFNNNEIEKAKEEYENLLNKYPMFENEITPKINKCKEILNNPPLELFLEKAKKYSSEALTLFNQNKPNEAITKWNEAISQYKKAKEIAEIKEDKEIINTINNNIQKLNENIEKTNLKIITDNLTNAINSKNITNIINEIKNLSNFINSSKFKNFKNIAERTIKNALISLSSITIAKSFNNPKEREETLKEVLNFITNNKSYLSNSKFNKISLKLNEEIIKTKLKQIENKIKEALNLKSNKEYSKAREILKEASKLLENLEDEIINKKIKTFNSQINQLKYQIETESMQIKNLLLGDESTIDIQFNQINPINPIFNEKETESIKKLKQLLSKYQNPIKIGEGGFAYVFKATKNNKTIALKVPKELTELTGKIFIREIENWKKLKHINIVQLYDYNIHPYPHIEIEYCETDLNKIKNKLNLRESIFTIFETLNGLKYAHNKGIIHKDLKPSNILISNNTPKITDWGLSKETTSKSTNINALTLQYSAPEQLSRGTIDKRTDIYQMGIILYELTTKKLPFNGNEFDIIDSIKNEMPLKPSKLNPLIDEELEKIILKCIQKEKSKRYQSVEQLQKDLANYLNVQLTTELRKSKTNNDFSRSVIYCADFVSLHIQNNNLPEALNYLYDLKHYADKYCSNEVIEAVNNLIKGIEYRVKEGIKEPSDDIKIKAKILIDKVKMRF